jgi:hypothetical protein
MEEVVVDVVDNRNCYTHNFGPMVIEDNRSEGVPRKDSGWTTEQVQEITYRSNDSRKPYEG